MTDSFTAASSQLPILRSGPNANVFVYALSAAYKARTWLYNPDLALARDAAAWEKVWRFPPIAHALQKRAHMVATRDWGFEPGGDRADDKRAAALVEEAFRKIHRFGSARKRLAHVAYLGSACEWVEGRRMTVRLRHAAEAPPPPVAKEPEPQVPGAPPKPPKEPPDPPPAPEARFWMITGFRHIDYRRIRLWPVWETNAEGKDVLVAVKPQLGSIDQAGAWIDIEATECLLRVLYDDEEGRLGYGRGMMEAIYWGFWIIELLLREGLEGVERWAQGWVVGTVDHGQLGSKDAGAEAVATAYLDALEKMRGRGVFVKGKGEELEVQETSGSGHQLVTSMIEMIVGWLTQLVLGSVRPSGGGEGGTFGQGKVEERSTDEVIAFDRMLLDEAITAGPVALWWRLNQSELAACGLADANMPRFVSIEGDDEDPVKFGEVVEKAQKAGLAVSTEEAYRRFGLKRPAPGEEVLAPVADVPSGFGGSDPFSDLAKLDKGGASKDGE